MILEQLIKEIKQNKPNKEADNQTEKGSENTWRSIVKSISWRIIGTIDTVLISWFITGELALAFSIGSIELITKMVLYFFHERIWNKIKWGK
ncbi:DUF2061 domain-containing protein [Tenacibaculum piscium]|uniref:DUF2061 domain-containing protein n=1 Tax=Tenacibaculum piscium TaxID=1458515 RepID=A0A2H1YHF9_9FLAO|nr:DUF2061 domain-containing protein [Tenacibaculum piscium]MBE7630036.1 DUF2061 domain-containing protein [Tenacibaculum piscium]MBE7671011.1 DUF2061 domain-containing protein [Tenacibaculum piscium]MBE7686039.1 DUF2061 domain-containing protein [Tenacibaculum piscium]MBE7690836.1 DUF2061 domain-containing protein [Tenacibaculum piscium]MCG8184241.1 DUF2061 domain-containing protein [Tenacibaculum piscium]